MSDISVNITQQRIAVSIQRPVLRFTIQSKGADGREVEMQVSITHVQWRLVGDPDWNNLVSLTELEGAPGADGLSVELQNTGTYIQWRPTGGAWQNIIAITDLVPDISAESIIALGIDELEFSLINSYLR